MASMRFTWAFLHAVLLWEIHCSPVKNGFAPTYKGGSTGGGSGKGFYQPEQQVSPGYDASSSEPGAKGGSGDLPSRPAAGPSKGYSSLPGSSEEVSWVVRPDFFSRGVNGPSAGDSGPEEAMAGSSYGGPPAPPPPLLPEPELTPGELYQLESTLEDGGYESETQERGYPPPPQGGAVALGQPKPKAFVSRPSFGHFYPYDWMFLTGGYPPGTYTHSSSSAERGRDDWQENHYLRYDYPTEEEVQPAQSFPSDTEQSVQPPGFAEPTGPGGVKGMGQQVQASDYLWGG